MSNTPATNEPTFTITIPDFTAGITSDDHISHSAHPLPDGSLFQTGAATALNTYRCASDVMGALVPLPARQPHVSEPVLPLGLGRTAYYPPALEESYQLDIKVVSPAFSPAYINREIARPDHEDALVAVIHAWYHDPYALDDWSPASIMAFYSDPWPDNYNWWVDSPPTIPAPVDFPDTSAAYIWDSSGDEHNAPQKTLKFRKSFTIVTPGNYTVYAAGDNLWTLAVDGGTLFTQYVDGSNWTTTQITNVTLGAGVHQFTATVENTPPFVLTYDPIVLAENPSMLIVALYDDTATLVPNTHTDATWEVSSAAASIGLYALVRIYDETALTSSSFPPTKDVHYYRNGGSGPALIPPYVSVPFGNLVHTVSNAADEIDPYAIGLGDITPLLAWVIVDPSSYWGTRQELGESLDATDQTYTTFDTDVGLPFLSDGARGVIAALHVSGSATLTYPLSRVTPNPVTNAYPEPIIGPQSTKCELLVGHNGRLLSCFGNRGPLGPVVAFGGDRIWYTSHPGFMLFTGTVDVPDYAGQFIAIPENSSGFGSVAALNAQDLLIVNNYGGGAVVSGQLNSPTINQLPSLHATYGLSCQGVNTPIGYIYGGRFGVYSFDGSKTDSISPQLTGAFWDHIASSIDPASGLSSSLTHTHRGNRGRFGWWDPYVLVPNNYLYDTRTKGWWRLELPTDTLEPYSAYDTSAGNSETSGQLYAMPWRKTILSDVTYDRYSHYSLADSYSWQSQPLYESRDRTLTCHQITFAALPAPGSTESTITLTLTGIDENGHELIPFTADLPLDPSHTRPQRFSVTCNDFTAYYLRLRIEAHALHSAAPKILPGLVLACRDSQMFTSQ